MDSRLDTLRSRPVEAPVQAIKWKSFVLAGCGCIKRVSRKSIEIRAHPAERPSHEGARLRLQVTGTVHEGQILQPDEVVVLGQVVAQSAEVRRGERLHCGLLFQGLISLGGKLLDASPPARAVPR